MIRRRFNRPLRAAPPASVRTRKAPSHDKQPEECSDPRERDRMIKLMSDYERELYGLPPRKKSEEELELERVKHKRTRTRA